MRVLPAALFSDEPVEVYVEGNVIQETGENLRDIDATFLMRADLGHLTEVFLEKLIGKPLMITTSGDDMDEAGGAVSPAAAIVKMLGVESLSLANQREADQWLLTQVVTGWSDGPPPYNADRGLPLDDGGSLPFSEHNLRLLAGNRQFAGPVVQAWQRLVTIRFETEAKNSAISSVGSAIPS